jgi:hypothetical protein
MEFLAGFESNCFAWGNANFGTGSRIASNAGFTRTYAEDAKTAQFDSVARGQRLFQPFEYRVDCRFRLCARQTGALDDVMHDILLDQSRRLSIEKLRPERKQPLARCYWQPGPLSIRAYSNTINNLKHFGPILPENEEHLLTEIPAVMG